jgi:hypothetical protein
VSVLKQAVELLTDSGEAIAVKDVKPCEEEAEEFRGEEE